MPRFALNLFLMFVCILILFTYSFASQDNVRVNTGTTSGQINVGSYCRTITNNAGTNAYIPADVAASWDDLIANNRFPAGITANSCCTPNSYINCPTGGGSTYWYDSCNVQGAEYDSCGAGYVPYCVGEDRYAQTGGCTQGTSSCTSGYYYTCPTSGYLCDSSNNVIAYAPSGCESGECQYSGGWTACPTGNFCQSGNVWTHSGCTAGPGSGCGSSETQNCGGNGCSGGTCNAPPANCFTGDGYEYAHGTSTSFYEDTNGWNTGNCWEPYMADCNNGAWVNYYGIGTPYRDCVYQ